MATLKSRKKQVGDYRLVTDFPTLAVWKTSSRKPQQAVSVQRGKGFWVVRYEVQGESPQSWRLLRPVNQPAQHADALRQAYNYMSNDTKRSR